MNERAYTVAFMGRMAEMHTDAWIWKISDRFTGGVPDLEVTEGGATVKIEFKVDDHKLEALQVRAIHKIRKAGGTVLVIRFLNRQRTFTIDNGRVKVDSESHRNGKAAARRAAEMVSAHYFFHR